MGSAVTTNKNRQSDEIELSKVKLPSVEPKTKEPDAVLPKMPQQRGNGNNGREILVAFQAPPAQEPADQGKAGAKAVADGKQEAEKEKPKIPDFVLDKATKLGLTQDDIKLEGKTWVGCKGDQCIPLASAKEVAAAELKEQLKALPIGSTVKIIEPKNNERKDAFVLSAGEASAGGSGFSIGSFGKFSRNPDGKTYSFTPDPALEGRIEISVPANAKPVESSSKFILASNIDSARAYVKAHPDEAIVILGTVPSQCPPCRALEEILPKEINDIRAEGKPITVLRLEYDDFASANKDFGDAASYPYMATFQRGNRADSPEVAEVQRGPILKGLQGLRQVVRGVPKELGKVLRGLTD
jgi:hypothetical protein